MQTVIKRPKVGQYLVQDRVKIEVIEVWGYYDCIQLDRKEDRDAFNSVLKAKLGENYRELYYQVYGRVLRGKPEQHKRWQYIVLDWEQVQNMVLV